jgi:hypothetical protein
VPADGGVEAWILFRKFDRAAAAVKAGADGNNPVNAGGDGAGDDFRQILFVLGIIQMRVRVVKGIHVSRFLVFGGGLDRL